MKFIHVRKKNPPLKDAEGNFVLDKHKDPVHTGYAPGVITFCYETSENYVQIGWAFCSPTEKGYKKSSGRGIARTRFKTNPIRLRFLNLEEVTTGQVLAAIQALWIENPEWVYVEEEPLRIGRFQGVIRAEFLGPDGSLVEALVDTKYGQPAPEAHTQFGSSGEGVGVLIIAPEPVAKVTGWYTPHPSWAKALLLEA